MSIASLDAVILDFGGILLDIHFDRLTTAIGALARGEAVERLRGGALAATARALEAGLVDEASFRATLRQVLETDVADAVLDESWNAVLGEPIAGAAELTAKLSADTKLYLLSNTNAIHHAAFLPRCAAIFAPFHGLYFSHEVGYRKPDSRIYERVLEERGLAPDRTVFVDDLEENVASAAALGIRTVKWTTNAGVDGLYDAISRVAV